MAEQTQKSRTSDKSADTRADQPARVPSQYTLRDSGKPLPPPVRRISPLTARRQGPPNPPAATTETEAKAPAAPPQAPAPVQGARPNPLTARRSLPSIAVISSAEPPPQVHPRVQEEPSHAADVPAALPVAPEPDPLPAAAESAPEANVDIHDIPVIAAESEEGAYEPASMAAENETVGIAEVGIAEAGIAAVNVPLPADEDAASAELPGTSNLPLPQPHTGAIVGFVPGAALAFLSTAQRARVREQAPLALPAVYLPPAAAALATLGRKAKGPAPRPEPRPEPRLQPVPPADPLPVAPPPAPEAPPSPPYVAAFVARPALEQTSLRVPAEPLEIPVSVASPSLVSEGLSALTTSADNPVSANVQAPVLPAASSGTVLPAFVSGLKPVISVRGIAKYYTMGDVEVRALQGVDLDIMPGEMTAIMGPSGSGKSTLMNILGCLDVPTSGTYLLDGEDVSRMTDDQLADVRSRKIGFVFQSFNLLSRTSALANVELPLLYLGSGARSRYRRAQQSLELVGLGSRLHHKPNELSGGQQQRVAIARALINEPAMILADEPTGNLDSKTSVEIMELFQRLNSERGITIIFVTHNIETADYCHRVIHVRDGYVERDVRHRPWAGIYRDLLPEDLPTEAVRAPASDGAPGGLPSATAASASQHTDSSSEVSP